MRKYLAMILSIGAMQALFWGIVSPRFESNALPRDAVQKNLRIGAVSRPTLEAVDQADLKRTALPSEFCCNEPFYAARFTFDQPQADQDLGLIPAIAADNFHVYLNGQALYTPGRLAAPHTFHAAKRSVLKISRVRLERTNNELLFLTVRGVVPYTDFYPFFLGDYKAMQEGAASRLFVLNEYRYLTIGVCLLIAFFMAIVLLQINNRAYAFWFGLLAFLIAVKTAHLLYWNFPFGALTRQVIYSAVTSGVALCWFCFACAWARRRAGPLQLVGLFTWLLANAAITAGWLTVDRLTAYEWQDALLTGFIMTAAFATVARLLLHIVGDRQETRFMEVAIFALCVTTLAVDIGHEFLFNTVSGYFEQCTLFLLLGLSATFVGRNVKLFDTTQSFRKDLESQLAAKENALAVQSQREQQLLIEQQVSDERERILRDMHDGLGGDLVSLAALFKDRAIDGAAAANRIYDTLEELRLIVTGMEVAGDPLGISLGPLRHRLRERLQQANMSMSWHASADVERCVVAPDVQLCLLRLMQECTTNAIKHSAAKKVRFELNMPSPQQLTLAICDDGQGGASTAEPGRGITNMRRRVNELNGVMQIGMCACGRGTALNFTIPLPADRGATPERVR